MFRMSHKKFDDLRESVACGYAGSNLPKLSEENCKIFSDIIKMSAGLVDNFGIENTLHFPIIRKSWNPFGGQTPYWVEIFYDNDYGHIAVNGDPVISCDVKDPVQCEPETSEKDVTTFLNIIQKCLKYPYSLDGNCKHLSDFVNSKSKLGDIGADMKYGFVTRDDYYSFADNRTIIDGLSDQDIEYIKECINRPVKHMPELSLRTYLTVSQAELRGVLGPRVPDDISIAYKNLSDGRHEGLSDLSLDSPKDFAMWHKTRTGGGHPFEILKNSLCLMVHNDADGFSLELREHYTDLSWLDFVLRAYIQINREGYSCDLARKKDIADILDKKDVIGIIPYCFAGSKNKFPKNLSDGKPMYFETDLTVVPVDKIKWFQYEIKHKINCDFLCPVALETVNEFGADDIGKITSHMSEKMLKLYEEKCKEYLYITKGKNMCVFFQGTGGCEICRKNFSK